VKKPTFEHALENNRLRGIVREHFEVMPLRRATDVGIISHALHIACGNGDPTALIMKHFSLEQVSAIDRDAESVAVARGKPALARVDLSVGDVCSLRFDDNTFDAIFDLAELHNYADWERGLLEMKRVLRPGGLLILEELSLESFNHAAGRLFRVLTSHPYGSMLTTDGFRDRVLGSGFDILNFEERNPLGLLRYFIMIARKA
jgi:SAM-dependent methyltransferase